MKTRTIKVHEVILRFEVSESELQSRSGDWHCWRGKFGDAIRSGAGPTIAALATDHLVFNLDELEVVVDGEPSEPYTGELETEPPELNSKGTPLRPPAGMIKPDPPPAPPPRRVGLAKAEEPRIFRSDEKPPAGKYAIVWLTDVDQWDLAKAEDLAPGDVYISAEWLRDL